jgi:hypothetical protein
MIAMSPVTDWGIANPGRTDLRRDWLATCFSSALHLHGRSLLLGKSEFFPLGLHVRLEKFCTNTALISPWRKYYHMRSKRLCLPIVKREDSNSQCQSI